MPSTRRSAPSSLITFAEARRRATLIVDAVERRYMPPWMPDQTSGASAAFDRTRRLSDEEMGLIAQWARDGFLERRNCRSPRATGASRRVDARTT